METHSKPKIGLLYLTTIVLLMLVFPVVSTAIDSTYYRSNIALAAVAGKWLVFWAIGMRLFTAGLKQVLKPEFTAEEIFNIKGKDGQVVIKELGFANICFGMVGMISYFVPEWRVAAAFVGGMYMGIAGINHIIKKPGSPNEVLAMVSDIYISLIMTTYVIYSL